MGSTTLYPKRRSLVKGEICELVSYDFGDHTTYDIIISQENDLAILTCDSIVKAGKVFETIEKNVEKE